MKLLPGRRRARSPQEPIEAAGVLRMVWRFVPIVGVLLLAAIAACWRPWLQFRRYGTWGISLFRSGNRRQDLRDGMLLVLFVLLAGQAIVVAGQSDLPLPAGLVERTNYQPVRYAGVVLMFAGLVLLVAAQLDLGASWRIGIDEQATPGLVTDGLYRFCRNPIYLALLMIVAGYTLLIPTVLSLALLIGTYVGARQQTLAEEAYLARVHGDAYRAYARRVGRFLPGIGLLR
jgi:protein-S-isoprenylcysteine O-methyltransferase Ste14